MSSKFSVKKTSKGQRIVQHEYDTEEKYRSEKYVAPKGYKFKKIVEEGGEKVLVFEKK